MILIANSNIIITRQIRTVTLGEDSDPKKDNARSAARNLNGAGPLNVLQEKSRGSTQNKSRLGLEQSSPATARGASTTQETPNRRKGGAYLVRARYLVTSDQEPPSSEG